MGKFYDQPTIEQVSDTATQEAAAAAEKNTATTAAPKQTTLKDIYIKQIDEFDRFVKGEIGFKDAAQRQEQLVDFITAFDSMLGGDYQYVKPSLHHLIGVINKSPTTYGSGEQFAPLYTMKKIPYRLKPERFIDLFCFFIGLAENIRDVKRYIGGRDIPYFLREFNVAQRENIVRFTEDLMHR